MDVVSGDRHQRANSLHLHGSARGYLGHSLPRPGALWLCASTLFSCGDVDGEIDYMAAFHYFLWVLQHYFLWPRGVGV